MYLERTEASRALKEERGGGLKACEGDGGAAGAGTDGTLATGPWAYRRFICHRSGRREDTARFSAPRHRAFKAIEGALPATPLFMLMMEAHSHTKSWLLQALRKRVQKRLFNQSLQ